jgi:hypothetical protein
LASSDRRLAVVLLFSTPFERPEGLGQTEWDAIEEARQRLERAKAGADYPLVLGAAKEFCETVAKVVIVARGQVPSASADLPELITRAHKLLEFQPGDGLAADPPTRQVAQSLKTLVTGLNELRNRYGTGHGRPTPSAATIDHAELAHAAAATWCAWALRRLGPYVAGDVAALVRDLDEGTVFYGGALARRLRMADMGRLSPEDQNRLGIAVARRASRHTVVVRSDGIEAVDPSDTALWPPSYVEGLVMGLLFDANGYFDPQPLWSIGECARLLSQVAELQEVAGGVGAEVRAAIPGYLRVVDPDALRETIAEFEASARRPATAPSVQEAWQAIVAALAGHE